MKKTHIGSKLDDLLKEDRLLEVATATATKRGIAHQIAMEMKRRRLTKMEMASRMKTSRAALDRHLGEGRRRPEPAAHARVLLRFAGD
jgi:antitoxin HicB